MRDAWAFGNQQICENECGRRRTSEITERGNTAAEDDAVVGTRVRLHRDTVASVLAFLEWKEFLFARRVAREWYSAACTMAVR